MYFIIVILFIAYFIWTWNSTSEFEKYEIRISYILIGTIFITFFTFVLIWLAQIGISYPKVEMVGETRKIILLIFIPINGLLILTRFSSLFIEIKNGILSKEELNKKIKKIIIVYGALIIAEFLYIRHIQTGIIEVIKAKM